MNKTHTQNQSKLVVKLAELKKMEMRSLDIETELVKTELMLEKLYLKRDRANAKIEKAKFDLSKTEICFKELLTALKHKFFELQTDDYARKQIVVSSCYVYQTDKKSTIEFIVTIPKYQKTIFVSGSVDTNSMFKDKSFIDDNSVLVSQGSKFVYKIEQNFENIVFDFKPQNDRSQQEIVDLIVYILMQREKTYSNLEQI